MSFPKFVRGAGLFGVASAAFVAYWLALPPVGWKYAIFVVPALWTNLVFCDVFFALKNVEKSQNSESLKKRSADGVSKIHWRCVCRFLSRPFFGGAYRQCWTAAFIFWLATTVWVSYPHPATTLGWIALSAYLALYFPLFIGILRVLATRFHVPIWLAAPVAWTAVEQARNHVLGGFSFGGLSHALYDSPYFIQIAESLGEYGVGATIVLVGALFGAAFFGCKSSNGANEAINAFRIDFRPLFFALLILGATVLYGKSRVDFFDGLERAALDRGVEPFRVGLLQDGTSYRFPVPAFQNAQVEETYLALAFEASRSEPRFDLLVWPESCFGGVFFDFSNAAPTKNAEFDPESDRARSAKARRSLARLTSRLETAAVLGTTALELDENGAAAFYNSAIFVPYFGDESAVEALPTSTFAESPTTAPIASSDEFRRYDKIRLVMFGEYIPFVEFLPDSFPLKAVCANFALGRGAGPTAFEARRRDGTGEPVVFAPNVCFESSIPHFIASQVRKLTTLGAAPDVLVNVSNDGWFRNGSQTDLHLATQVFRAIENRKTVVSATHGGFSAWIDPAGRVRARGARGASQVVAAQVVPLDYERSSIPWSEIFVACCASASGAALAFVGAEKRTRRRKNDAFKNPR